MRLSVLFRPVVAVAALAVGSAVLAAVPATAATPSGITRTQVLNAAASVRADFASHGSGGLLAPSPATIKAIEVLANRSCVVKHSEEVLFSVVGLPFASGDSADGLLVLAPIFAKPPSTTGRICVFGALAASKTSTSMSGTAAVVTDAVRSYALSGDVYTTPVRSFAFETGPGAQLPFDLEDVAFTANGTATTTIKTTTTKTVKTPKTKAQKKSAKKKYTAALKSAKKKYNKDLKKAGSSKSKKAAAKKAYNKKKAAAKAAYKKRIATKKIVKVTTVKKTPTPFDVQAMDYPTPP